MVCDRVKLILKGVLLWGLNPYSIGIWSATLNKEFTTIDFAVLILILLEYGLRPCIKPV